MLLAVVAMSWTDPLDRWFVFFPTAEIERNPASVGLDFEDVYFVTGDGVTLNGWYVPARPGSGEPSGPASEITFLWFHGNGGNLSHRVEDLALLNRRLGVNVFIFDYRGYGRSEGRPSESGVYRDARAALNYLRSRSDVDPNRVVFFGRSLGTVVAVELAAAPPEAWQPYGIILVSPLTSISDMARAVHTWLPMHWLAGNRFNTLARIGNVHSPLLLIHSDKDEIVPVEQGRRLFKAANHPKSFHLWSGAGHNDGFSWADAEFWTSLDDYLASLASLAANES